MPKIGVIGLDMRYLLDSSDNLKREVLLFDELEVYEILYDQQYVCNLLTGSDDLFFKKIKEIEQLQKFGLVKEFKDEWNRNNIKQDSNTLTSLLKLAEYENEAKEIWNNWRFKKKSDNYTLEQIIKEYFEVDSKSYQILTRAMAIEKNLLSYDGEFIPLVRRELHPVLNSENNVKTKIINLSISKLPVIDDSVSYEQILEIKLDNEFRLKYFAFKEFINSLSNTQMTTNEIDEKIEYLLMDYESRLKIHRAKYNLSTLEAVFVSTSELIENLVKLKIGKVAKTIISFKNKEIELLEEERKIPGREIAVLYDIKNIEKSS